MLLENSYMLIPSRDKNQTSDFPYWGIGVPADPINPKKSAIMKENGDLNPFYCKNAP